MNDVEHLGRPLRLRCQCLVIHAADDLRVVEQDTDELAPGQVLVRWRSAASAARTCTTSTTAASAPCASSGR